MWTLIYICIFIDMGICISLCIGIFIFVFIYRNTLLYAHISFKDDSYAHISVSNLNPPMAFCYTGSSFCSLYK